MNGGVHGRAELIFTWVSLLTVNCRGSFAVFGHLVPPIKLKKYFVDLLMKS